MAIYPVIAAQEAAKNGRKFYKLAEHINKLTVVVENLKKKQEELIEGLGGGRAEHNPRAPMPCQERVPDADEDPHWDAAKQLVINLVRYIFAKSQVTTRDNKLHNSLTFLLVPHGKYGRPREVPD